MATPVQFISSEELVIDAVDADGTVRLRGSNGLRQIKVKDDGMRKLFVSSIGKKVNFGPAVDLKAGK